MSDKIETEFGVTRGQYDCLCVLQELLAAVDDPPTIELLAAELSSSPAMVRVFLDGLQRRGRIAWNPSAAAIRVLKPVELPEDFAFELTDAGGRAVRAG